MKVTKSTFNRLFSIFIMVMAVIFGVNGQVLMAESALPDGGTSESGHPAEAGGAPAAGEAGNGGVQEFGFFVELDNTVEGLVRVEDIKGDYFIYNPDLMALLGKRSKRKYAFGDRVVVKVVGADKDKSTIDFEIYEEGKDKKKKNDTKK